MYRQSRYHRTKGSKVKKLLQASVLLCIIIWLLYETKHSLEGKKGNTKADYSNLSKIEGETYFGRKVNPGSQYGLSTTEAAESGGNQADAFDWHSEEMAEDALKIESEESREDIMDSGEDEDEDKLGNFDNVAEAHISGELNSEGLDQNESNEEAGDSNEENGGNGEATTSDKVHSSSTENSGQGSEPGEIGQEYDDNAVSEVPENSTDSGETGEEKNDNALVEQDTANPRSDDVDIISSVSSNVEALESDEVESRRTNSQEAETNEQHSVEAASDKSSAGENNVLMLAKTQSTSDKSSTGAAIAEASDAVNASLQNSTGENKEVRAASNGVDVKKNQVDSIPESHNTGSFTEAATTDTNFEGENATIPNSTGKTKVVMSDNNGKPKEEAIESQERSSDSDSRSHADEQNSAEKVKNDSSRREASESEGSNALDTNATSNGTVIEAKSSVEVAMVSLAKKDEHIELPANNEDAKLEVGSTGVSALDSENSGSGSLVGAKALSDGELADSSQENMQNNSEVQANENGEAAEAHGNVASETASTTPNALEDTRLQAGSIDPNISSSTNNFGEESIDVGRRGSTGSESSTSSSEEKNVDVKKSVEL